MRGAHSNHLISVDVKTKKDVLSILENEDMVMAEEIKFLNQSTECACGILPLQFIVLEVINKKLAKLLQQQESRIVREIFQYPTGDNPYNFSVDGVRVD